MADQTQPPPFTQPQATQPPYAQPMPPAPPRKSFLSVFKMSGKEVVILLLILNLFGMVGLFIKIEMNKPAPYETVSVAQMGTVYEDALSKDPTNSPDMIKAKTQIYMAVTQKALEAIAAKDKSIILVRECVLAGEYRDLTPDIMKMAGDALSKNPLTAAAQTTGALNAATGQ